MICQNIRHRTTPVAVWMMLWGLIGFTFVCSVVLWAESKRLPAVDDGVRVDAWTSQGPAEHDDQTVRQATGGQPSLRIERRAGEGEPQFVSDVIELPGNPEYWIVAGWLKLKDLYFQDPSFQAGVSYQWIDAQGRPINTGEPSAFNSYDIQRAHGLSTRSGSTVSFDWAYAQQLLQRPANAVGLRLTFSFDQGDGAAWLTDVTVRPATALDVVASEQSTQRSAAPKLRLRDGRFPLEKDSADNLPLFTPDEPIQVTASAPGGRWSDVEAWLTDADGGVLWTSDVLPVLGRDVAITVPPAATADAVGECLTMHVRFVGEAVRSEVQTLDVGILPQRQPLDEAAQKASPFGLIGSISSPRPRSIAMMHRAGVQWIRYRGVRWRQDDPEQPQDIEHARYANNMQQLKDAGFKQLIQTFATAAPSWARDQQYYHRGKKVHIKSQAYAEWIAHVGQAMPGYDNFKLLNERDRDPDEAYLAKYAELMKAGYESLKEARPDATISVEGGFTPQIVQRLLDLGLYDHMDVVDHHLYGDYPLVLGLQKRLQLMRDAGYDKPVIASEFGVVPGSGSPTVGRREIARGMVRNTACWLAVGGKQFYPFLWGTLGPRIDQVFTNLYFVCEPGEQPTPLFFVYANLSRLLEGAEPIGGPALEDGLYRMSFARGDKRIDIVWARTHRAGARWQTNEPIQVIEALGRRTTLQPAADGLAIELGQSPVMVVSSRQTVVHSANPMIENRRLVVAKRGGVVAAPTVEDAMVKLLPPRGWQTAKASDVDGCWHVQPAEATPTGSYTWRWCVGDEQNVQALVFETVQLVPNLSAEVVAQPGSDPQKVVVKLANRGTAPWSGQVHTLTPPAGRLFPTAARWQVDIPAESTQQLTWELDRPIPEDWQSDPVFSTRLFSSATGLAEIDSRTTFRTVPHVSQSVKADGHLDDWVDTKWMPLPASRFHQLSGGRVHDLSPKDDTDLSARAALAYGGHWLALAVDVQDDIHWNALDPASIWAGDAIEFTLGIRERGRQELPEEYFKIAVALSKGEPVAYGFLAPAGRVWAQGEVTHTDYAVRRTDEGHTIYEVVLYFGPLRLKREDDITFALAVDEADQPGVREGFLPLFDGVANDQGVKPQGWFTFERP